MKNPIENGENNENRSKDKSINNNILNKDFGFKKRSNKKRTFKEADIAMISHDIFNPEGTWST